MRPARSRLAATVLTVVATVSMVWLPAMGAGAEDGPGQADPGQPGLTPGSWVGVANAVGSATATEQGVTFRFHVDIDADLSLEVPRDGAVTGDWRFEAPVRMDGTGLADGRSFTMRWVGPITGTGTITGSPTHLTMVGTQTSGGTVTVEVDGMSHTTTVSEQNPSPPLEVDVLEATCDEVFGDWVYGLEAAFTEAGWRPEVTGLWFAWRDTSEDEAPLSERGELGRAWRDLVKDVNQFGVDQGLLEPVDGETVGEVPLDTGRLLGLVDRVVDFHNTLRNLGVCEARQYTEDELERFFTVATDLMGNLIGAADLYELSPSEIRVLMDAGLQLGAVGAGATHPRAAELEGRMHDQAATILERWLDDGVSETPDGPPQPESGCTPQRPCIIVSPEALDVLSVSAVYGWSFQVGDRQRTAAWLLERASPVGDREGTP